MTLYYEVHLLSFVSTLIIRSFLLSFLPPPSLIYRPLLWFFLKKYKSTKSRNVNFISRPVICKKTMACWLLVVIRDCLVTKFTDGDDKSRTRNRWIPGKRETYVTLSPKHFLTVTATMGEERGWNATHTHTPTSLYTFKDRTREKEQEGRTTRERKRKKPME